MKPCEGCRLYDGKCLLGINEPPKDGHCWEKRRGDGVRVASRILGMALTFDAIAVSAVLLMHGNAWPLIALYWLTLSVTRILDRIGEAR